MGEYHGQAVPAAMVTVLGFTENNPEIYIGLDVSSHSCGNILQAATIYILLSHY